MPSNFITSVTDPSASSVRIWKKERNHTQHHINSQIESIQVSRYEKEKTFCIGSRTIVILQQSTLLPFHNLFLPVLINPQPTLSADQS